jgi:DNA-binding NtrC family response regulator
MAGFSILYGRGMATIRLPAVLTRSGVLSRASRKGTVMKVSVLIADSDDCLQVVYRRCLERQGYDVHTATDALECWDKLWTFRPNALVLERNLLWGGCDGVLARIKEDWGGPMLPVMLTVGEGSPEEVAALMVPPVTACLQKPFHLTALAEALGAATVQGSAAEVPICH